MALGRRRVVRGGLAGVEQVIAAKAGKAALGRETGAAAVDMESHIAADYATKAGLPFAALRVISRSRQPRAAGDRDERDQAEWRHRSAQGSARCGAQPAVVARLGLHRDRFQPRTAQPARLPKFSAGRRDVRPRGAQSRGISLAGDARAYAVLIDQNRALDLCFDAFS